MRGRPRGPVTGRSSSPGSPWFLRNEQEEEAIWKAQFEAGSQILGHLDRALELHRMTDFQICLVGGSLLESFVFGLDFGRLIHALPLAVAEGHLTQKE